MSGWKAKRFWKKAAVGEHDGGFAVKLDDRPLRTPAKSPLLAPTRAMAEAIVAEWDAVADHVDPGRMPVTRAANAAIDKVAAQFGEVADLIAEYGGSDLLCYRAEAPEELAAAQAAAWDPMLDWAVSAFGVRLTITRGVVPVAQRPECLARLSAEVHATSPFQLVALHDLVSLSGSLILGLAATRTEFEPEMLWRLSRVDEEWQISQWGEDDEAAVVAERKRAEFHFARSFWQLATPEA